jgi:hypothetical protein
MAGGGLGPIWAAAVVPACGHDRSPVGLSAMVGAFFEAAVLLCLADVSARVILDLPDFFGGLGNQSCPVVWGLGLNNDGGPSVPLMPRRRHA